MNMIRQWRRHRQGQFAPSVERPRSRFVEMLLGQRILILRLFCFQALPKHPLDLDAPVSFTAFSRVITSALDQSHRTKAGVRSLYWPGISLLRKEEMDVHRENGRGMC
jgi:hypothetical protein